MTTQEQTVNQPQDNIAEAAPKVDLPKKAGKKREKKVTPQDGGSPAVPAAKKTKRAKQDAPADAPVKESSDDDKKPDGQKKRTFTVVRVVKEGTETDFKGGRYSSSSPSSAARKSANLACKSYGGGQQEIDIYMQETTKGSAKKLYAYKAVRSPVDEKDVSFKTDKGEPIKVPFKFQMSLKSIKEKPEAAATTA